MTNRSHTATALQYTLIYIIMFNKINIFYKYI